MSFCDSWNLRQRFYQNDKLLNCHDHSFLNVKFISGSPMFPSLTPTIRLGKGVNVTLTVLWHILVQCILWSHYEICKRVIIMLYGIEKSMHIFPSVECNNYLKFFFSRKCTTIKSNINALFFGKNEKLVSLISFDKFPSNLLQWLKIFSHHWALWR